MSRMPESQLHWKRLWVNAGYLLLLTIFVFALLPVTGATTMIIPYGDKIAHAIGFAVLMVWFGGLVPRRNYPHIFIALVVYGAAIEVLQNFTGYRSMEFADLLADTLGLAIGWVLCLLGCARWPLFVEGRLRRS